jgi:hypothetical protein
MESVRQIERQTKAAEDLADLRRYELRLPPIDGGIRDRGSARRAGSNRIVELSLQAV